MEDTRPKELIQFLDLLTEQAPESYEPWLFRVEAGSKAPDLSYGSWKDEKARLSKAEAVQWMESGGNVGIAGTEDDALVNVDIDDEDETTPDDLKDTLIARSRSRTGVHAWYFEAEDADIPNIPTNNAGEVRSTWQYVVAPGSYVETDASEVPQDERDDCGYYTVERTDPVAELTIEELPEVFRQANRDEGDVEVKGLAAESRQSEQAGQDYSEGGAGSKSALFDVTARDVALKEGGSTNAGERWAALFHDSDTGKNMSLSDKGRLHCWRHNVAHNGIQALSVLSDYTGTCEQVGSPHKNSNAGDSCLHNEQGAHIWHAWKYAKQSGYIPEDDPVPYSAIKHLCRHRQLCPVTDLPDAQDESIPGHAYDAALSSIENHDELDPGRDKTDEIVDENSESKEIFEQYQNQDDQDTGELSDDRDKTDGEGGDTKDEGNADTPPWADIHMMYAASENDDEKLQARHTAAQKLSTDHHWRNIRENDQLYAYDYQAGIFRPDGESRVRDELVDGLQEQYKAHELSEIKSQLRGRHTVSNDDIGGDENMICCENCVLQITADGIERHQHDPSHEFIGRVQTPYDPDAECPRWRQFLEESLDSEATRKKLQEFAGYTLMHWKLPHHKALFLVGPTASGKSTFLDTIRTMLGNDAVSSLTPQQMTSERFGGAELHGSWANIRNDIPTTLIENTGQFKELIAGDPIKAEQKYQDPFMFEPTAKHMFSANQLPDADTDDRAFFRRILLAAFPNEVPREDRDPQLDNKLQGEHAGILNWALDGLRRLMNNGGFTGDRPPFKTEDTWAKWGNSIERFEQVAIQEQSGGALPSSDVFQAYLEFCEQEGIPAETNQQLVTKGIKAAGYQTGREYYNGSQTRCILNADWTGRGEQLVEGDNGDSQQSGLGN